MSIETFSPEANYLTRNNIVHPAHGFLPTAAADLVVAADEAKARAEMTTRSTATVTGGTIKRGK